MTSALRPPMTQTISLFTHLNYPGQLPNTGLAVEACGLTEENVWFQKEEAHLESLVGKFVGQERMDHKHQAEKHVDVRFLR